MPHWLQGVLIIGIIFVVGVTVLIAVMERVFRAAAKAGRYALAALSTGGVSLFTQQPDTGEEAARATRPRTRLELVLGVFATGGLSAFFTEPPDYSGRGGDASDSSGTQ